MFQLVAAALHQLEIAFDVPTIIIPQGNLRPDIILMRQLNDVFFGLVLPKVDLGPIDRAVDVTFSFAKKRQVAEKLATISSGITGPAAVDEELC